MANLSDKEFPDETHEKLKRLALDKKTTLKALIRAILASAVMNA